MDLDIDQVFMYILHRPLFLVVGHITSLYQIAARTTDTRVKEVLIAVAKEFMNIMLLFELEHRLDFRINIQPLIRFFRIRSFAQIASKSSALQLACAYAPACCSAAAWIFTRLVDKINNEGTKNVLRLLIKDFNRISIAFQSISEMIFIDQRPINPEIIRPLILQNIRPWIPYIPPFPVPRVDDDQLVFSGLLTESMLDPIFMACNFIGYATGKTYKLLMFMEDGVALDRLFNVLTYMVIAQSLLEHHFPRNIQTSRPQDEDRLRHRRQEVNWMLSQVSDIAIMALVEIESFTLSINSRELEEKFGYLGVLMKLCTFKLYDAFTIDSH